MSRGTALQLRRIVAREAFWPGTFFPTTTSPRTGGDAPRPGETTSSDQSAPVALSPSPMLGPRPPIAVPTSEWPARAEVEPPGKGPSKAD